METYLLIGLSAANLILLAVLLALTARTRRYLKRPQVFLTARR